jgi:hypothetical protein
MRKDIDTAEYWSNKHDILHVKYERLYSIAYEALNIAGGLTNYVEPRPELTNAERAIARLQKELRDCLTGHDRAAAEGEPREDLYHGPITGK